MFGSSKGVPLRTRGKLQVARVMVADLPSLGYFEPTELADCLVCAAARSNGKRTCDSCVASPSDELQSISMKIRTHGLSVVGKSLSCMMALFFLGNY
jgi:hypothetical protein